MRGYPGGMKAVLSALLIFAAPLCAGEYQKDFADLKAKVPKEKMDAHLADWRTREPENPDAWILSSNWTLEQADGVEMRGKNGKKLPEGDYKMEMQGERIIIVGKDGKPLGEMISAMNPDGVRKAAGFLGEALKKWPHRADIHCGLATIFARDGFWKEHVETLRAFAKSAHEQAGKLRWCHDRALDEAEEEFVAGQLHSFAMRQYEKETPEGDRQLLEIGKLLVETCPKSVKGYNDVAIAYVLAKDWKAAQTVFEKAAEIAPDDSIVWMNLGDNSARLGNKPAARKAYERVLELKPKPEMLKDVREKLAKLEKDKA